MIDCSSGSINSAHTLLTIQEYNKTGLVGNNTTSPQYTLDVNGSCKISGDLNLSGFMKLTTPNNNVFSKRNGPYTSCPSGTEQSVIVSSLPVGLFILNYRNVFR